MQRAVLHDTRNEYVGYAGKPPTGMPDSRKVELNKELRWRRVVSWVGTSSCELLLDRHA